MPDWIIPVIVALLSGGLLGTLATSLVTERRNKREDRDSLIDQLQEERKSFVDQLIAERAQQNADRVAYTERLDKMWADKAASREHVAALRDHIWQRKDPPPPEPPAGYIH